MKRCPECRRDYADDTLLYCLEDGTALVQGSVPSPDEPQTAILHETDAQGDAPTRAQIHTTEQTAVLPSGITPVQKTSAFDKRLLLAPVALAVIALGGYFGYRYLGSPTSGQIDSIAVMPFANDSGDPGIEYLSDGMTETLINSLSGITDLQVKARSSVFRYKGKEFKPQTVASELGVQTLLTGRIVQRGDQLILNLELIDPGTENVLWGNRYERKSSELVALQTEITKDVLGQLKSRLSGEDNAKIAGSNTDDSEAYKLYLKGRYYAEKRTGKDLLKSLEFYDQAVAEDPNYALAYTGLAESYGVLSIYGVSTPKETMPKAREAATKALALNNDLAEAHSALGNVLFRYDYDFEAAERELQRAIELNPKYGFAHNWNAELLSNIGRHDEAIRSIQRALEIDPLSLTFNRVYAFILFYADRFEEAEAQHKKTIELDENYAVTYMDFGNLYEARKDYVKAVEMFTKGLELSGNRERAEELRGAFSKDGWTGYLRKRIELADSNTDAKFYQDSTIKPYCFVGLGQNDKALDELEKIFEMRYTEVVAIKVDPLLDPLREEPRFKELIRKVGFPE
ncbi:MAG: hypothetical protein AB7Q37_04420 [Pyrinomonadaceae bacterium]